MVEKFIQAKIDIASFDFNNEAEFLKVLGKTAAEYWHEISLLKSATQRLKLKYHIAPSESCETCVQSPSEKIANIKKLFLWFKSDKKAFAAYIDGSLFTNTLYGNRRPFLSLAQCIQACNDANSGIGTWGGSYGDLGYCLNQCMSNG